MAKQRIYIEKLQIKLPQRMADNARSIGVEFGYEIMKSVADVSSGRNGKMRIDKISATINHTINESHIRKLVTEQITSEVRKNLVREINN